MAGNPSIDIDGFLNGVAAKDINQIIDWYKLSDDEKKNPVLFVKLSTQGKQQFEVLATIFDTIDNCNTMT